MKSGDSKAQVEANKRIATLAFENAKLEQAKAAQEVQTEQPKAPTLLKVEIKTLPDTSDPINPDPKAEAWAAKEFMVWYR